ncbi:SAM-dependent methyltransferase [Ruminiclostridium cellobioparum]|uniref:SAM-dependent methyltransferase n=1 Tax=Ruminiclostridium cellobioparum TaxID=29355 RepID=UPI0006889E6D|nr:SAM-dependent methyltransferase [Ruminiclostridium cellobioparum]
MANNCKVFTPQNYVIELLNAVNYNKNLYGKKVLENSCGTGYILMEIVARYIADCLKKDMSEDQIIRGLENDICGVELEEENRNKCIENLNIVAQKYNINGINWNILLGNYLLLNMDDKFSFIIGNPPYITYKDIEINEREAMKAQFHVCMEGKFDYYYAFVEKGILELNPNGKMAYIIPASIYKNVFAQRLRDYIKPLVTDLYDYTYENKFPGYTTSSTILILNNGRKYSTLKYHDVLNKEKRTIAKTSLAKKWCFNSTEGNDGGYRFGDYFKVSNTIATLYNEAFLLDDFQVKGEYIFNNGKPIERTVVRDAISRKKGKDKLNLKIIFPYTFCKGQLIRYEVNEFEKKFPCATEYLKQFLVHLHGRDSDKSAKWFEYGRSQAIAHMDKPKLTIPSIITTKLEPIIIGKDVIPCAGFYIIRTGTNTLEEGKRVLESKKFFQYLKQIGIFTTGKSRRITVKDIEEYRFVNWE